MGRHDWRNAEVIPFPAWMVATLIAMLSVWMVGQYDTRYAWLLAAALMLGVVLSRNGATGEMTKLLNKIFGTGGISQGPRL